jgi:hypothetical protein
MTLSAPATPTTPSTRWSPTSPATTGTPVSADRHARRLVHRPGEDLARHAGLPGEVGRAQPEHATPQQLRRRLGDQPAAGLHRTDLVALAEEGRRRRGRRRRGPTTPTSSSRCRSGVVPAGELRSTSCSTGPEKPLADRLHHRPGSRCRVLAVASDPQAGPAQRQHSDSPGRRHRQTRAAPPFARAPDWKAPTHTSVTTLIRGLSAACRSRNDAAGEASPCCPREPPEEVPRRAAPSVFYSAISGMEHHGRCLTNAPDAGRGAPPRRGPSRAVDAVVSGDFR